MSKPYQLFISYASDDDDYASRLAKGLRYLGIKVWFAPLALVVGENLLDSINAGLMASEFGIVLLSASYISKKWTKYELNVLHRQYIENSKKLFPLWHGVDKNQIDAWNPGLSGIVALNSSEEQSVIVEKIANVVYQNSPTRGITPSWENPQWRFIQGQGELLVNAENGGVFNLFEAAKFSDDRFPLYVYDRPYSKREIISAVASALYYNNPDTIRLSPTRRREMLKLCKDNGFDVKAEYFDAAIDCIHQW